MSDQAQDEIIDIFNTFATDEECEKNGVETTIDGCGPTKFRIAKEGNDNYDKLLRTLYKKNKQTLTPPKGNKAAEALAQQKMKEIQVELYARTILLGWDTPILFQGQKLEYSLENARKLLSIRPFRAKVTELASGEELFLAVKPAEEDEEEQKN